MYVSNKHFNFLIKGCLSALGKAVKFVEFLSMYNRRVNVIHGYAKIKYVWLT